MAMASECVLPAAVRAKSSTYDRVMPRWGSLCRGATYMRKRRGDMGEPWGPRRRSVGRFWASFEDKQAGAGREERSNPRDDIL